MPLRETPKAPTIEEIPSAFPCGTAMPFFDARRHLFFALMDRGYDRAAGKFPPLATGDEIDELLKKLVFLFALEADLDPTGREYLLQQHILSASTPNRSKNGPWRLSVPLFRESSAPSERE